MRIPAYDAARGESPITCVEFARRNIEPGVRPGFAEMEKTVKERNKAVAAFVRGTAEGWKSYFENPAPANALIKKANPQMDDEVMGNTVRIMKTRALLDPGSGGKIGSSSQCMS